MSSYVLDLRSSIAKLDRAKKHIDGLRTKIAEAGRPDPEVISLRRQFEPEHGAVICRVERVLQTGEDWELIIGDALNNLRAALDHLMWQLAVRHNSGVAPKPHIATQIYFPIVFDKGNWARHKHRKLGHISIADSDRLEKAQPFNMPAADKAAGKTAALGMLATLSNTDKHRTIHLTYCAFKMGHRHEQSGFQTLCRGDRERRRARVLGMEHR